MPLVRYNPWRELNALQRQMNRVFYDFNLPTRREQESFSFAPAAELSETDGAIQLKLEVPGMKPEDLDVRVTPNSVTLSGERREETQSSEQGWSRSEFRYGKFERTVSLPAEVDNTQVRADYKEGILTLNLPKAESAKNKVVKVNVG